jgi:DNA-binding beta-propeller fold protein YncE
VAHPQIAAFARLANGAATPARRIYGQSSKLSRTMHDIRYNAVDDEILVPNPFSNAILTFRGGANGQEAPLRVIQGRSTQLVGSNRLAIDVINREIFVPNGPSVAVYSLDGNGDVSPKRVIRGPDTQLGGNDPPIAVDPEHNLLIVAGNNAESILVFDRTASGNAKPLRIIRGPNAQIDRINQFAIYAPSKLLVVAMPGRGVGTDAMEPPRVFVGVWSLDDDGDVAPKWAITGDQTTLKKPFAVALNPDQKELYVTDMRLNGVLTFFVPEIFEPVASNAAPGKRQ